MGPTILDQVQCQGSESSLFQCPYSVEVGETHVSNSVGIECSKSQCVQLHVQTADLKKKILKHILAPQQLPLLPEFIVLAHVPYKYTTLFYVSNGDII